MNRLKKKAWTDLVLRFVFTIVMLSVFGFWTWTNVKVCFRNAVFLAIFIPVYCISFVFFHKLVKRKMQSVAARKNQYDSQFDERELYLIQKSVSTSVSLFIAYGLLATILAFYFIGGQGMVPMWSIVLVFFLGLFLSGTVQSFILLHYAKEDDE